MPLPEGKDVFGRGGAVVSILQRGDVIAGPLYDAEGIVFADCDLRRGLHAKRWFDAVGHYSRSDVLDGLRQPPARRGRRRPRHDRPEWSGRGHLALSDEDLAR